MVGVVAAALILTDLTSICFHDLITCFILLDLRTLRLRSHSCSCLFSSRAMPRDNTISWSQSEEENLLPWLSRHRELSWKARSNAYFKQYRRRRSGESLRGKQNQILRKLGQVRRRTSSLQHAAAHRVQTRHRSTWFEAPTSNRAHGASDPAVDQIVGPTRQLQITASHSYPTLPPYLSTQRVGKSHGDYSCVAPNPQRNEQVIARQCFNCNATNNRCSHLGCGELCTAASRPRTIQYIIGTGDGPGKGSGLKRSLALPNIVFSRVYRAVAHAVLAQYHHFDPNKIEFSGW